jgi:hypothetical protein
MSNLPAVSNPFGTSVAKGTDNAISNAEEHRAIQEVQAAMVIAKKFPRNQMEAVDRIIEACTRQSLAEGALYSYSRGGTEITGPSIRLAEAMAQVWGNMQFGIRELSTMNGSSTVETFAWDMETNTRQVKVFQVPHIRYSKNKGNVLLTDPRDIYEMIANQGARRLRACILGVIPGDVTEAAVRQCEVTQAQTEEVTPETIKALLEYFQSTFGVSQELIEKRIQKHASAMNAAQKLNLKRIAQSMKDGMSKPSDWFDIEEQLETVGPKTSDLAEQVKAQAPVEKAPSKRAKKVEPDPVEAIEQIADAADEVLKMIESELGPEPEPEPPVDDIPWPPAEESEVEQITYAWITDKMQAATSVSELNELQSILVAYLAEHPDDRPALSAEWQAKKKMIIAATKA